MQMFFQLLNTGENMRKKGFGVGGIFFRNVIGFVRQIGQRSRQPLNLHTSLWFFCEIFVRCKLSSIGFLQRLFDFLDLPRL